MIDEKQNPQNVKVGQVWETTAGGRGIRQFGIRAIGMMSVRGRIIPAAETQGRRRNRRGLETGFAECRLVKDI
jgi:hypothetical protein